MDWEELLLITLDLRVEIETALKKRVEIRLTTMDFADDTDDIEDAKSKAEDDKVSVFFEDTGEPRAVSVEREDCRRTLVPVT